MSVTSINYKIIRLNISAEHKTRYTMTKELIKDFFILFSGSSAKHTDTE